METVSDSLCSQPDSGQPFFTEQSYNRLSIKPPLQKYLEDCYGNIDKSNIDFQDSLNTELESPKAGCPFPRKSHLTWTEQQRYLELYHQFSACPPQCPSKEEIDEIELFKNLQMQVGPEQEEFMEYLRSVALQHPEDYSFTSSKVDQYMKRYIECSLKRVSLTARYYTLQQTLSLKAGPVYKTDSVMKFVRYSLILGVSKAHKPPCSYKALSRNQSINQVILDKIHCKSHQDLSSDVKIADLVATNPVDFIISSEALLTLLDNHQPNYEQQWEIPFTVHHQKKGSTIHKVIVINPPLMKKSYLPKLQNTMYHTQVLKHFIKGKQNKVDETETAVKQTQPETGKQIEPETGKQTQPETGKQTEPETGKQTEPETGTHSETRKQKPAENPITSAIKTLKPDEEEFDFGSNIGISNIETFSCVRKQKENENQQNIPKSPKIQTQEASQESRSQEMFNNNQHQDDLQKGTVQQTLANPSCDLDLLNNCEVAENKQNKLKSPKIQMQEASQESRSQEIFNNNQHQDDLQKGTVQQTLANPSCDLDLLNNCEVAENKQNKLKSPKIQMQEASQESRSQEIFNNNQHQDDLQKGTVQQTLANTSCDLDLLNNCEVAENKQIKLKSPKIQMQEASQESRSQEIFNNNQHQDDLQKGTVQQTLANTSSDLDLLNNTNNTSEASSNHCSNQLEKVCNINEESVHQKKPENELMEISDTQSCKGKLVSNTGDLERELVLSFDSSHDENNELKNVLSKLDQREKTDDHLVTYDDENSKRVSPQGNQTEQRILQSIDILNEELPEATSNENPAHVSTNMQQQSQNKDCAKNDNTDNDQTVSHMHDYKEKLISDSSDTEHELVMALDSSSHDEGSDINFQEGLSQSGNTHGDSHISTKCILTRSRKRTKSDHEMKLQSNAKAKQNIKYDRTIVDKTVLNTLDDTSPLRRSKRLKGVHVSDTSLKSAITCLKHQNELKPENSNASIHGSDIVNNSTDEKVVGELSACELKENCCLMQTSISADDTKDSCLMQTSTSVDHKEDSCLMQTSLSVDHKEDSCLMQTSLSVDHKEDSCLMQTSLSVDHKEDSCLMQTSLSADDMKDSCLMQTSLSVDHKEDSCLMQTSLSVDHKEDSCLMQTSLSVDHKKDSCLMQTSSSADHKEDSCLMQISLSPDGKEDSCLMQTNLSTDGKKDSCLMQTSSSADHKKDNCLMQTPLSPDGKDRGIPVPVPLAQNQFSSECSDHLPTSQKRHQTEEVFHKKDILQTQTSSVNDSEEEEVNYSVWSFGKFKILVKTHIDGRLQTASQNVPLHIQAKLEYQAAFGHEQLTVSEVCQGWLKLFLTPGARLARGRINVFTSELMKLDYFDLNSILNPLVPFNPGQSMKMLHLCLKTISCLSDGDYLLSHNTGDLHACIYQRIDPTMKKSCYDLHTVHQKQHLGRYDATSSPWLPLDPNVFLKQHTDLNRIPATFPPKSDVTNHSKQVKGAKDKRMKRK